MTLLAEPPVSVADHTTPLVRNCWYMAARADEVGRTILARRLLGVDVALYRTLAGAPVAVRNRCPHRSYPLARGRLEGDILVCGYHGMQFDPSGRCVAMPSMPIAPAHAHLAGFPVAERGPVLWIWMGDPDRADEALIPDTSWLADPAWATVGGRYRIASDYIAMHENLLDQTHFPFLHPGTVGTPDYARSSLDVAEQGDAVLIRRALKASPPPGIYAVPMAREGVPVHRTSEARFASPALHTAFARLEDPADGRIWRFTITHLITPESRSAIHYWWFNSRDFKLGDAATDRFLEAASAAAYTEDVEALEAIAEVVHNDAEPQVDLNFAPDKPGLLMRRAIARMAAREA